MTCRNLISSLGAALAVACLAAPAAHADVDATLSVTPSSAQAGGSPNVIFDMPFSSSSGDDVRDVAITLPPGLVANPRVAPKCPMSALESDSCSPDTAVGTGDVTASAWFFTVTSSATAYLVTPQGDEIARLGLVVKTPLGSVVLHAPVLIKTTPQIHIEIPFEDLPRSIGGISITIEQIRLMLAGTVNGKAFTRLPTACVPATSGLRVVSWDEPAKSVTASSVFTPTGCGTLAYEPKVTAAATIDDLRTLALTTAIAQTPAHAATRGLTLTLPEGAVVRPATLLRACDAPDPTTCPPGATVGTATLATPLLANPIAARIVLVARGNGLPGVTILVPAPFTTRIDGVTGLTPQGRITVAFDGLPDLPLNRIDVALDGGPNALLGAEREICASGTALNLQFTAHSAATAAVSAPVQPQGCDRFTTVPGVESPAATPAPAPAPSGGSTSTPGTTTGAPATGTTTGASANGTATIPGRLTSTVTMRGLRGRRARLSATVRAATGAPGLQRVEVCLPSGLSIDRGRIRGEAVFVVANGKRLFAPAVQTTARCISVARPAPGARSVIVTLNAPALRASAALKRSLRKRKRLAVTVRVSDAAGAAATLKPSARPA